MNLNIKKYVPFMLVLVAIVILSGTSYALLKSTSKGSNPYVMNVGVLEISFQDNDEDKLTLVNQIPISDEEGIASEEEYEFTIKNTGTLPATYSVYIEETSTNPEFKSVIRYIISKNEAEYTDPKTLSDDKYIDTNATLAVDATLTYKVKLWLALEADSTYMNKTFTARIVVDTTLNYEGFGIKAPILGVRLASYEEASLDTFEGGLVAINTDGTLYNENDTTQAIREYRYSGPSVNNYVFFDTNNNGVKEDNEIWRIVGIFKNDAGNWNLKLMRNIVLSSEELPSTYIYDETSYLIEEETTGTAYWNSTLTAINYNDWTTAGLQYYLNGEDGYFGTISTVSQALIDTSYTYYLGNVGVTPKEQDTTVSVYKNERGTTVCDSSITKETLNNNCNVWYGNKTIWNKSLYSNANGIALLYPSDYGYSASSIYWSSTTLYYYSGAKDTSWMWATNTTDEWFLSPSSSSSNRAAYWFSIGVENAIGAVLSYYVDSKYYVVRPVLNLLSTATIEDNGADGSATNPYVIVLE